MNSNPAINDRSRILQLEAELTKTRTALKSSEEKLAILIENMPGGIMSYDADTGKFDFLSKNFLEIFNCTEEQFRERYFNNFNTFVQKEDRGRVKELISDQLRFFTTVELTYRTADIFDEELWIYHRARLVINEDGSKKFFVVVSDITDEKLVQAELSARNQKLRAKSERDPMTELLNKVSMQTSIEECLASPDKNICHAMFMIDTDNFKSVNDTFGHQYGDKVIIFVANAIKRIFRNTDFVARMGGDEFMVFMRHTTPAITELRAKQLNDAIRKELLQDGQKVNISCSIGISYYPRHGSTYEELYEKADKALYTAKENGKNQYDIAP